jgi:hypothetical protein
MPQLRFKTLASHYNLIHIGIMLDEVALKQVFLQASLVFPLLIIIPP